WSTILATGVEQIPVIAYDATWGRLVAVQTEDDHSVNETCLASRFMLPPELDLVTLLNNQDTTSDACPPPAFSSVESANSGWSGIAFGLATWARLEPGH